MTRLPDRGVSLPTRKSCARSADPSRQSVRRTGQSLDLQSTRERCQRVVAFRPTVRSAFYLLRPPGLRTSTSGGLPVLLLLPELPVRAVGKQRCHRRTENQTTRLPERPFRFAFARASSALRRNPLRLRHLPAP